MLLNLDVKVPHLVRCKLSWVHLHFHVNQLGFDTSSFFDAILIYNFARTEFLHMIIN